MARKDVDEIFDLYNQLQSSMSHQTKKKQFGISKQISMTKMGNDFRKGSLCVLPGSNCKKDPNLLSSHRQSLFCNDRSNSMINLCSAHPDQKNDNFTKYSNQSSENKGRKIFFKEKSSNNSNGEINIYEPLPATVPTVNKNVQIENFQYSPRSSAKMSISFIEMEPYGLMKSKDSMEMTRKSMNKPKFRFDIDSEDQLQMEDVYEQRFALTQDVPIITLNSEANSPALFESIPDHELPHENSLNKYDSNNLPFSMYNETMESSESGSDISDPISTPQQNGIFHIETDASKLTDKIDNHSVSSANTESFTDIKTVTSEEDKNKLLQMIAKDLSMKTYSTKEIIRFYMVNGTFSSQIIDISQTASTVSTLLKGHFNINPKTNWQIIEFIQADSLERPLEDHENILDIYYSWQNENIQNRFLFRENPKMYQIFLKPALFKKEMQCDFQIEDIISLKEANSQWKKLSCFISDSTVYFKIKPNTKEKKKKYNNIRNNVKLRRESANKRGFPLYLYKKIRDGFRKPPLKNHKDLYSFVNLKKFDFYTCTDVNKIKKKYKAPTNELIVFSSNKLEHKSQEHPCLCFPNSSLKEKWLESLKIAKFSFDKLKQNYLNFEKKSDTTARIQSFYSTNNSASDMTFNPSSI